MNPQPIFYDLNSGYQTRTYLYLINFVKPNVKPGQHILDIGCGSGRSTYDLHKNLFGQMKGETIGLDLLPEMIERAKQSYKLDENVQADIADPNTLSLTNNLFVQAKKDEFDHIVTSFCLHWVEDQRQALSNIRQLLKKIPGSSLHILMFSEIVGFVDYASTKILANPTWNYYLEDLRSLIKNMNVPWKRAWYVTQNPVKSYCRMMVEVGFEDKKIVVKSVDDAFQKERYNSMEEMQNMIRACFPNCLQRFNNLEGLKDEFFRELTLYIGEYNELNNGDKLVATSNLVYISYTI